MKLHIRILSVLLATGGVLLVLAVPATATFPGKNGRIAFISGPDVYTMKPDGSDVKQLTSFGSDDSAYWESWSPDGKQIVFVEFRPPDFLGQLWLMNAMAVISTCFWPKLTSTMRGRASRRMAAR